MKKSLKDRSIGAQMAIASQLMKRNNHKAINAKGHKITIEQMAVLEILKINGPLNLTEISIGLWKQNANITRIVDKLEKQELVLRKATKNDRRAFQLSITDKGISLYKEVIPIVMNVSKEAFSCLTKEEEKNLLTTLKKIINHISE